MSIDIFLSSTFADLRDERLEVIEVVRRIRRRDRLDIDVVTMEDFGFSDLRLVTPRVIHLSEEARHMAVKAAHLLESATIYDSLTEAVADCQLVLGTTRRFGRYREEFVHPEEAAGAIAGLAAESRAALVFGREDTGLTTAELDLCQRLLTIPVADQHPSMNLAQAVCVCLYETGRAIETVAQEAPTPEEPPAAGRELEEMYQHMEQTLFEAGFLDPQNPKHLMRAFRRMLGRQGLTSREVRILRGLVSRIAWLDGERKK